MAVAGKIGKVRFQDRISIAFHDMFFIFAKNVIGHLNKIFKNERTAINLYFLRAPSI